MSDNSEKTLLDFKVDAIDKLTSLLAITTEEEVKLNIFTSFGTVQGYLSTYTHNHNIRDLNQLMNDVATAEYLGYLNDDHPNEKFKLNFIVLETVTISPFANPELELFHEQFVLFTDQIIGFNFV